MKKPTFDDYQYDDLSQQIWNDNYRGPDEENREDTWTRAAKSCAGVEVDSIKEQVEKDFLNILYNDRFVPGGRILANLGIPNRINVTQYNCFVHHPRDIGLQDCDSIDGIYDLLKAQAKTLRSEGGYGINASFLRPAGVYINGIGSRTPGVVKFMELWDKSSEILTMGSIKILGEKRKGEKNKIRKGAQMLVLDVWHPEIKEFIVAKQTEGRLTKFNVSVGVTEGFMQALLNDEDWDLKFPDTECPAYETDWFGDIQEWEAKGLPVVIHETLKAKEIWELIMQSTYNRNEPGVLFLDVANKLNPVYWFDLIKTTNPCFSGDTKIAVADGRNAVSIKQLAEEGKDVPVYSLNIEKNLIEIKMARNPRITGYNKKLIRITLDDGSYYDVTPDHTMILRNGEKIKACELKHGDSLSPYKKDISNIGNSKEKYYRVRCNIKENKNQYIFEHRLISQFYETQKWKDLLKTNKEKNKWSYGGLVVHHKDYNGLNNSPDNLEIMTFKEHQKFHADHDCAGEKNGRFYGKSSQEIKEMAIKYCKQLNRPFSKKEWRLYAETNGLPKTFSKMHHCVLGKSSKELADLCSIELGLNKNIDIRLQRTLKKAIEQGYESRVIKNEVFVTKTCEGCSSKFEKVYEKREIAFCSYDCYSKNGMKDFYKKLSKSKKEMHAKIWSQLFFDLKRNPLKKEWEEECKKENVSFRLGGSKNNFKDYSEVSNAGRNYNHKVVSVIELDGEHTVYNLTVDDNHTVSIVTEIQTPNGKKLNGINTLQCGEVPMSTGVCNLGSINLVTFVKEKGKELFFDLEEFGKAVKIAIRFLDNINDISTTPLPEYKKSVLEKRRIGLGVMGLGSLHLIMGIRYGSKESLELVEKIFKKKSESEILASALLGKEKGSFEKFDKEKYFSSVWWKNVKISEEVKKEVESIGEMRNSHQSMNAPTGNTGIYARNVSGGIEPVFDTNGYYRWSIVTEVVRRDLLKKGFKFPDTNKSEWFETEHMKFSKRGDEQILKGSFEDFEYEIDHNRGLVVKTFVEDYGLKYARKYYGDKFETMKEQGKFASAQELTIKEHVDVLSVASHYTNMAISKTVNVPNKYPYEDFKNLYMDAWKNNLKGITTYRADTMTAVLESKDSKVTNSNLIKDNHAPKRPQDLLCDIHTMTVKGEKWTFFVGKLDDRPYEILGGLSKYINIPKRVKTGKLVKHNGPTNPVARYDLHYDFDKGPDEETIIKDVVNIFDNATEAAFTRTLSLSLRHGVPVKYIVEQVVKGSEKDDDLFSFSKAVSRVLKTYIVDGTKSDKKCIRCGSDQVVYQEGCTTCMACGNSKCA